MLTPTTQQRNRNPAHIARWLQKQHAAFTAQVLPTSVCGKNDQLSYVSKTNRKATFRKSEPQR